MPFYSIKHNVCIFLVCKGAIAIAVALVREEGAEAAPPRWWRWATGPQ